MCRIGAVAEVPVQHIPVGFHVADLPYPQSARHVGRPIVVYVAVRLVAELGSPARGICHGRQDASLHRSLVRTAVTTRDGERHGLVGVRVVVDHDVSCHGRDERGVLPAVVIAPFVYRTCVTRRAHAVVGERVGLRLLPVGRLDADRVESQGEGGPRVGLVEHHPLHKVPGKVIHLH